MKDLCKLGEALFATRKIQERIETKIMSLLTKKYNFPPQCSGKFTFSSIKTKLFTPLYDTELFGIPMTAAFVQYLNKKGIYHFWQILVPEEYPVNPTKKYAEEYQKTLARIIVHTQIIKNGKDLPTEYKKAKKILQIK